MKKLRFFTGFICLAPLLILISFSGILAAATRSEGLKASSGQTEGIHWRPYQVGMAEARQQKKPVFIDFYTDWCHWCHELDRTTYKDVRVISLLNEKFMAIKIDAESKEGEPIASRYPIRGYPSLWFLKSTGDVISPINGYLSADQIVPFLLFVGDGYYNTLTFDEFMKSKYPKLKK